MPEKKEAPAAAEGGTGQRRGRAAGKRKRKGAARKDAAEEKAEARSPPRAAGEAATALAVPQGVSPRRARAEGTHSPRGGSPLKTLEECSSGGESVRASTPPRRVGWSSPVALIQQAALDTPVANTKGKDKGQGKGKSKGPKGKRSKGKGKPSGKDGKSK